MNLTRALHHVQATPERLCAKAHSYRGNEHRHRLIQNRVSVFQDNQNMRLDLQLHVPPLQSAAEMLATHLFDNVYADAGCTQMAGLQVEHP